jgi:hypothetical protein
MEFEITFTNGAGPADIEMAVSGVPTLRGFRLLNEQLISDLRFRAGRRVSLISVRSTPAASRPTTFRA